MSEKRKLQSFTFSHLTGDKVQDEGSKKVAKSLLMNCGQTWWLVCDTENFFLLDATSDLFQHDNDKTVQTFSSPLKYA